VSGLCVSESVFRGVHQQKSKGKADGRGWHATYIYLLLSYLRLLPLPIFKNLVDI
jgi:hypothetical protein